mmetsp:Transcript_10986/g.11843  ORF Transcript_10986/g.11843 Transcript_10986/m.11843 type:complete len:83 (-) Transcript_10986:174-422(-)|eukprot:CAMPEP_0173158744 /NCGR_PEP_ID=MMETSP1105-20130129/16620_1 /TAXON_ID=2985 /ORGANISM="Ochromonas sp., Strain BG-1" /LENGTH=82 /DNA_ID=CAMNT_0014076893 /DNA_START=538 /DNA_END=786 /DNA_ORIENTATION=+
MTLTYSDDGSIVPASESAIMVAMSEVAYQIKHCFASDESELSRASKLKIELKRGDDPLVVEAKKVKVVVKEIAAEKKTKIGF